MRNMPQRLSQKGFAGGLVVLIALVAALVAAGTLAANRANLTSPFGNQSTKTNNSVAINSFNPPVITREFSALISDNYKVLSCNTTSCTIQKPNGMTVILSDGGAIKDGTNVLVKVECEKGCIATDSNGSPIPFASQADYCGATGNCECSAYGCGVENIDNNVVRCISKIDCSAKKTQTTPANEISQVNYCDGITDCTCTPFSCSVRTGTSLTKCTSPAECQARKDGTAGNASDNVIQANYCDGLSNCVCSIEGCSVMNKDNRLVSCLSVQDCQDQKAFSSSSAGNNSSQATACSGLTDCVCTIFSTAIGCSVRNVSNNWVPCTTGIECATQQGSTTETKLPGGNNPNSPITPGQHVCDTRGNCGYTSGTRYAEGQVQICDKSGYACKGIPMGDLYITPAPAGVGEALPNGGNPVGTIAPGQYVCDSTGSNNSNSNCGYTSGTRYAEGQVQICDKSGYACKGIPGIDLKISRPPESIPSGGGSSSGSGNDPNAIITPGQYLCDSTGSNNSNSNCGYTSGKRDAAGNVQICDKSSYACKGIPANDLHVANPPQGSTTEGCLNGSCTICDSTGCSGGYSIEFYQAAMNRRGGNAPANPPAGNCSGEASSCYLPRD